MDVINSVDKIIIAVRDAYCVQSTASGHVYSVFQCRFGLTSQRATASGRISTLLSRTLTTNRGRSSIIIVVCGFPAEEKTDG